MLPIPPEFKSLYKRHKYFRNSVVYKYTTSSVAEKMVEKGSMKIGSLLAYREIESEKLRDLSEGKNIAYTAEAISSDIVHDRNIIKRLIEIEEGCTGTFRNLGGEVNFDFPIICFSYVNNEETMLSLSDEKNNYDTCVQVSDILGLAEKVSDYLSNRFRSQAYFRCLPVYYRNRIRPFTEGSPPNDMAAFEKEPSFEANAECRILFRCESIDEHLILKFKDGATNDHIFELPSLKSHFEIVDISS